jgi:acyl-CoA reductase-like NAD-dependent aldehyde dehydrogenase
MSAVRDASQEERGAVFEKFRKLAAESNEMALAVLTAEQKKSFEEMRGEKFELQMRRGPRRTTT